MRKLIVVTFIVAFALFAAIAAMNFDTFSIYSHYI
jgi:hypothetical protein